MSGNANTKKTVGGSLASDMSKLAVPFGILLAQKGLGSVAKKEKATATSAKKAASAPAGQKAAVGGAKKNQKNRD